MPRMSKTKRIEMSIFINDKGRIEYNHLCKACAHRDRNMYMTIPLAQGVQFSERT